MTQLPPTPRKRARRKSPMKRVMVWLAASLLGAVMALLVFGALPFMQMLGDLDSQKNATLRTIDTTEAPPPQTADLEEPPPPEEEEPEEKPQMDEPAEAPDLNSMADSLNPGSGGGTAILGKAFDASSQTAGAFAMNDDIKPRPVQQVPAKYPADMAKQKLQGVVKLEFTVDANGRVQNPKVIESPHRSFEAAALAAIKQWKFEPGRRGGQKVPMKMRLPMRFAAN